MTDTPCGEPCSPRTGMHVHTLSVAKRELIAKFRGLIIGEVSRHDINGCEYHQLWARVMSRLTTYDLESLSRINENYPGRAGLYGNVMSTLITDDDVLMPIYYQNATHIRRKGE